jgi:hypothetical protein
VVLDSNQLLFNIMGALQSLENRESNKAGTESSLDSIRWSLGRG